jgi:hypothetical protein
MCDMNESEKEKEIFSRRIDRALARSGKEGYKLRLFIRVSESDLYDWDVTARSILCQLAYMGVQGNGDPDKKIKALRATPAKSPFKDYNGWVWGSQDYLAERVGTTQETVSRKLARMAEDNVVFVRSYATVRAEDGYKITHHEYKINEEMVDAHKRTGERKPKGRKPGTKAFKSADKSAVMAVAASGEMTASHVASRQPVISGHDTQSSRDMTRNQTRDDSESLEVRDFSSDVSPEGGVRSTSTTPTASLKNSSPASREEKIRTQNQKQLGSMSTLAKKEEKPKPKTLDRGKPCAKCGVTMYRDRNHACPRCMDCGETALIGHVCAEDLTGNDLGF